jgi:hypothetical protein
MKCKSCGAPISPAFVHSIQSNICPACGNELMSESTREFINEIKEAFEKMPANPQGLAGWLLSHYELVKIGTGEPVGQFYGSRGSVHAPQHGGGDGDLEDQLRNQPKIASNKMQQFYQTSQSLQRNLQHWHNKFKMMIMMIMLSMMVVMGL